MKSFSTRPPEDFDGDCFRQSLAFVMGEPPDSVPHFFGSWDCMMSGTRDWLQERGLDLLAFWFSGTWDLDRLLEWFAEYNPDKRAILQGAAGYDHAVGIEGGRIISNICPSEPLTPGRNEDGSEFWMFYVVVAKARKEKV